MCSSTDVQDIKVKCITISTIMEKLLTHTSLILFSSYTVWSVQPGSSLFSWHPTCMIISQLLALEGVLLYRAASLKWRVTVHWIFQGASMAALITGFTVIYINKNLNEKPHFASTHGIAGLTTLIVMIIQSFGGILGKLAFKTSFLSTRQIKTVHRWSGIISVTSSLVTVFIIIPNELVYFIAVILPSLIIFTNILRTNLGKNYGQNKK